MQSKKIAGIHPEELTSLAAKHHLRYQKMVGHLKAKPPSDLDQIIHEEHHRQFEGIDCLDCANCCKTTPALIIQKDIDRIAAYLKLPVSQFMERYIIMDEDGDFVINKTPCPFLQPDNKCQIYDVRPKACSEYPMTLRKKQVGILDVSLANTSVCPAVFRIFERLEGMATNKR